MKWLNIKVITTETQTEHKIYKSKMKKENWIYVKNEIKFNEKGIKKFFLIQCQISRIFINMFKQNLSCLNI